MHVEKEIHGSLLQYVGPKSCSLEICCPKYHLMGWWCNGSGLDSSL